jgi:hypothetical protein
MIDTHTYFKTLKEAGFDDRQADAMTRGITEVVIGSLATKADLAELRAEMNQRFAAVNDRFAAFENKFAVFENRFAGFENKFVVFENKLTRGLQTTFVGVIASVGVFIALATYVGTHVR